MAGMIEVAQATVSIIPNMQGAQQTITSQLTDISGSAGLSASNSAGKNFVTGLTGKLGALKGVMAKVLPAVSVAAVGKALFSIGSEFDEMTDNIVIGTGASGEALESLKQSAMDMATAVPMSFGDAGDIVQDLNTRLGLTGDALTEVGTQVAQLGEITGEAFNTEAFSGAMAAWGTSAEDMSGQLDMLFAVSQSTGIGMNDLTGIMEGAAPQMQALGYSFEDTAAMAGLLDKAGLNASGTMTKMSKALVTMAKDGEEPTEALKRVTGEIDEYIKSGDKASAVAKASEIFGTKGAAEFVAAVESGAMSIDEFSASLGDTSGIINETQTGTMDFAEHVQVLKNQFKALLEPMGSAVFGGISTVMGKITEAFGKFVKGPGKTIQDVFKKVVSFGSGVVKTFKDAFGQVTGVKSFGDIFKAVGNILKTVYNVALKPVLSVLTGLLKTVIPPLAKVLGAVLGVAFRTFGTIVETIKGKIETFKGVLERVRAAFQRFKNIITAPFRFLSGLKIPRISISGGSAPWGIGGLGEKPSISVKWAAKGGVLNGATFVGAGEAGKEALLPLERDTSWADIIADRVQGNQTNNFYIYDANDPERVADAITRRLKLQGRSS